MKMVRFTSRGRKWRDQTGGTEQARALMLTV